MKAEPVPAGPDPCRPGSDTEPKRAEPGLVEQDMERCPARDRAAGERGSSGLGRALGLGHIEECDVLAPSHHDTLLGVVAKAHPVSAPEHLNHDGFKPRLIVPI